MPRSYSFCWVSRDAALRDRIARPNQDAAGNHIGPGGFQAAHQNVADELPLARLDVVVQIRVVRNPGGRLRPVESSIGIAVVEEVAQDRVAVRRDIRLAKRLPRRRLNDLAQMSRVLGRRAFDVQFAHGPLHALFDFVTDPQFVSAAAVVVERGGRHLHIAESVGAVQVENGVPVVVAQLLRVAPVAIAQLAGLAHRKPLANGGGIEETIAGDLDAHQPVTGVAGDRVGDPLHARRRRLFVEIHHRIEIALRLEIIHQVARAFEQQAAVDGALLKDGDQLAQLALRDLGAAGADFDQRSVVDHRWWA